MLSTSFFMAGAIFSFLFIWFQSSSAVYFLPQGLVENMDIQESGTVQWNHPIMSGFIMTNNLYVALQAFVYGISAGVGTAYILLSNGLLLGALSALAIQQGQALVYWSLILPHGIIELAAIFLSGAAGLKIGYALIRPQPYRRKRM